MQNFISQMSLFHPFKIVTCTGVDLNFITFIDEDGYFDFSTGFQSCILVTLVAVSPSHPGSA